MSILFPRAEIAYEASQAGSATDDEGEFDDEDEAAQGLGALGLVPVA